MLVHGECDPFNRCTDVYAPNPTPPPDDVLIGPGFVRETILTGSDSRVFNGIGPGLDIEMDAGRYGQVGVSLFLGARAYRVLGERTIEFSSSQSFDDQLGMDTATATWEVDVNPWVYRTHVGVRFQWLGLPN